MRTKLLLSILFLSIHLFAQDKGGQLEINFSVPRGVYNSSQTVSLNVVDGAKIYYTTDGKNPLKHGKIYKKPLQLDKTTVIKAVAKLGKKRTKTYHQTYFINEPETNFMMVELTIEPRYLFDAKKGLFMEGEERKDTTWVKRDANFWSKIERRAHLECFDPEKGEVIEAPIGFKVFGGMSRLHPQKSFSVTTRKYYGEKRLNERIFGSKTPKKFKNLVFRNSGSDFGYSHFRDALMTNVVENWDVETQLSRPCHMYINGKYWGIYNIREKINRHYLNAHADIDKDSVNILEHKEYLKFGTRDGYVKLLGLLETLDLTKQSHFDSISQYMDVENFTDYMIAQIFYGNKDAGGNIRYWKPSNSGKWRWILYDTDQGFGLYSDKAYQENYLKFFTEPNGPIWPNPPWSTFILRRLLDNSNYVSDFTLRFQTRLNEEFSPENLTQKIDSFVNLYQPEIPRHHKRWRLKKSIWEKEIRKMKTFAIKRKDVMQKHLDAFFGLSKQMPIVLDATQGGDVVVLNDITVKPPFLTAYTKDLVVKISAKANLGYRFSHWEGSKETSSSIFIKPTEIKGGYLRAIFVPYDNPLKDVLVINEVCPQSKLAKDWVEIFNRSDKWVDVEGWVLEDSKNTFTIPKVKIQPLSYLVICQNENKFKQTFFGHHNLIGGLPFGINKYQEKLTLYANDGSIVDEVEFLTPPTDSNFTLSLLLPELNNKDEENWVQHFNSGSPGRANPHVVESRIQANQLLYKIVGGLVAVMVIGVGIYVVIWRKKRRRNRYFQV